jgi:hypothetical protein
MALFHSIHTWHDAAILAVLLLVWYTARSFLALAKRVTVVSLPKREARFKEK